jgi:hypothetical protein
MRRSSASGPPCAAHPVWRARPEAIDDGGSEIDESLVRITFPFRDDVVFLEWRIGDLNP